jgi:hypothetical protein
MLLQSDELLRRFGSEVAAAADAMIVGPPRQEGGLPQWSLAPLHRLRDQAERYLRVAKTARARLSLFMFSVFLQDVFYNLVGDVPYEEESERCRQQFFVDLARYLRECSSAIADEEISHSFAAWEEMVSAYCKTVNSINEILANQERRHVSSHP